MTRRQASPAPDGPADVLERAAPPRSSTVRVLGIDPGATIGWGILDVGPRVAHFVLCGDFSARTDVELLAALAELERLAVAHVPAVVAVERVVDVHGCERMGSGYAEGLARSNWVGGEIAGLARAMANQDRRAGRPRPLQVATVAATCWRSVLVGSRSATDARVAQMIRLRVPTWPAVSNAHQRDGAGVALWAGLNRRAA